MYFNIKYNPMETKICTSCKKALLISEFYKQKRGKFGVKSICKSCSDLFHKNYRKNNLEQYAKYQKKHRDQNKDYNKNDILRKEQYVLTIKGRTTRLYSSAKNRAKNKGWEFNITPEFIYQKLLPLKCEVTNLDLSLDRELTHKANALAPSLDRINSNKGYTLDNVQIVCWWYNVMKQDWSKEIIKNLLINYKLNNE